MDGIQISSTARLDKDGARPGVHNGNLRLFYQDSSTPRWTATFPLETKFQFFIISEDQIQNISCEFIYSAMTLTVPGLESGDCSAGSG